jgi:hypothetical protein
MKFRTIIGPCRLLVAASKICERVVLKQLTEHMTKRKRFTKHQSGNRKLHSTETLNIFISDLILQSMDRREGLFYSYWTCLKLLIA